jgi:hypothetical protein
MEKLKCVVTVELADEFVMDVQIRSWFPRMQVNIVLSHPDLLALNQIVLNKLLRGDREGYEYNIDRYLQRIDELVRDALSFAKIEFLVMQQRANALFIALIVCCTLIYVWNPIAGIVSDMILGSAFIYLSWIFARQKCELDTFIDTQLATFADRAGKLRQSFEQAEVEGR